MLLYLELYAPFLRPFEGKELQFYRQKLLEEMRCSSNLTTRNILFISNGRQHNILLPFTINNLLYLQNTAIIQHLANGKAFAYFQTADVDNRVDELIVDGWDVVVLFFRLSRQL